MLILPPLVAYVKLVFLFLSMTTVSFVAGIRRIVVRIWQAVVFMQQA